MKREGTRDFFHVKYKRAQYTVIRTVCALYDTVLDIRAPVSCHYVKHITALTFLSRCVLIYPELFEAYQVLHPILDACFRVMTSFQFPPRYPSHITFLIIATYSSSTIYRGNRTVQRFKPSVSHISPVLSVEVVPIQLHSHLIQVRS